MALEDASVREERNRLEREALSELGAFGPWLRARGYLVRRDPDMSPRHLLPAPLESAGPDDDPSRVVTYSARYAVTGVGGGGSDPYPRIPVGATWLVDLIYRTLGSSFPRRDSLQLVRRTDSGLLLLAVQVVDAPVQVFDPPVDRDSYLDRRRAEVEEARRRAEPPRVQSTPRPAPEPPRLPPWTDAFRRVAGSRRTFLVRPAWHAAAIAAARQVPGGWTEFVDGCDSWEWLAQDFLFADGGLQVRNSDGGTLQARWVVGHRALRLLIHRLGLRPPGLLRGELSRPTPAQLDAWWAGEEPIPEPDDDVHRSMTGVWDSWQLTTL